MTKSDLHRCGKALWALYRSYPDPVLVYQMAKVGSTSVTKSLKAAGINPLHVHYINPDVRRVNRRKYIEAHKPIPYHFHIGYWLYWYLKVTSEDLRVITLVRDPIARHVSAAFQNIRLGTIHRDDAQLAARQLEEDLRSAEGVRYAFAYFDREMEPVLGVNPAEQSFNREQGFGICKGRRATVLTLKLERLSTLISGVVSEFMEADLEPVRANVKRKSDIGDYYTAVKREFDMDRDSLREIYDHPWVKHFYTEKEVNSFIEKWS